ncbi:MAG: lysophospholipid acyltransferase family protein [Anaerolineae bacterium]
MYDNPPSPFLRGLASFILKILGWKVENGLPDLPKYIAIAAPHTSNMDAIVFLCGALQVGIRPLFTVKHTAFKPPFGGLLRWLGAYPVDRTRSTKLVDQVVDYINKADRAVFAVTPEGTRKRTEYWKSGFYHMARKANVPIVFGYVDYKRKVVGARLEPFYPSGDIQKDMEEIAAFYSQFTPDVPENFGPVRVRPHETGE